MVKARFWCRFPLAGLVLGAALIGRGPVVRADPFAADYVPALGALELGGDLRLRVPLAQIPLGAGASLDLVLDHDLVPLDYGEVRSRIVVRPLATRLFAPEPGVVLWLRPGGGSRRFTHRDLVVSVANSEGGGAPSRSYRVGQVSLTWTDAEGGGRIEDGGWRLDYVAGHLVGFTTPAGVAFSVECIAGGIVAIRRGGALVLRIEPAADGALRYLEVGANSRFTLVYSADGLLAEVWHPAGRPLARFAYDGRGLLSEIAAGGLPPAAVAWAEVPESGRGDSPYPLPLSLARDGTATYEYSIRGGVVRLEQTGPERRSLRVGTRYGRILWVDEKP